MGGQETMFVPPWREMLHHCRSSSHTTSCRLWGNDSIPCLSLICSWTGPWVWVQEEVKKWLEIHNLIQNRKDFTALYIYRICQTSWGWSKSFAWIPGHSCKDRLFLGTFIDLWSCIHCNREQEQDNLTLSGISFQRDSSVSVPHPARTGLSFSQISAQVSTLAGNFLSPQVHRMKCLNERNIIDFFFLYFQGLSIKFPSPFFSLHCTSDGSIWIEENYL